MKYTLNLLIALFFSCLMAKATFIIIEKIGIDFVGIFQSIWEKARKKM